MPLSSYLSWIFPFRIVSGVLAVANVAAFILYFAPEWRWFALTSVTSLALFWFAFFPRRLQAKNWLITASLALIALAIAASEARVALSVIPRGEWFPFSAPLGAAVLYLLMLVEAVACRWHVFPKRGTNDT